MYIADRLISHFTPVSYNLSLTIDRVGRAFHGTVIINGKPHDNTLKLHHKGLTIHSACIDGKPVKWSSGADDELTLAYDGKFIDTVQVEIEFSGIIIDHQLHGLYPCYYTHDGAKQEILMTQFESHYAREVFPCIDEPEAKTTFDVTLTTESGVTVIGNMPVVSQRDKASQLVTTFDTTPRMSTYLLAFVIGELQKKTGATKDGVEVNVYATPAQPENSLDFALEHSVQSIEFFNDYFGVPYPLPKCDQVAIPDFANGAMENWGLLTYRESCLLYDPALTDIASKQYIASVISHEVSHQWFGDLVTMKWWDDVWLNESFATVMASVAVDALHPDWGTWLDFNISESVYALRRDSLTGVQPVKVAVHHPDEIQSIFDGAIVYAKGARLMRMIESFVGETAFRAGLKSYFEIHAYGNTIGDDLWSALNTASGKNVKALMDPWLLQNGFPVVHAHSDGSLSQEQFVIGPKEDDDKLWPIPLGSNVAAIPELLKEREAKFDIDGPYRLNTDDTAHFITHYDERLLSAILDDIKNGKANEITRAQIIKEQTLLAKSPILASAALIDLLIAYKNETNDKVWSMMAGIVSDLKRFVDPGTPEEKTLKHFALIMAQPMYQKLGWNQRPNESEDDTMLRATVISLLLYGEDPAVIAEARKRYAEQTLEMMDAELRGDILIAEVRFGNTSHAITDLMDQFKITHSADIKDSICDAVTSTDNLDELEKLLALLKDLSVIRTQDTIRWFVRLLANRHSRDFVWKWLRDEWAWVVEVFDGEKSYDSFAKYSAQLLSTRQQLAEFRKFFTPLLKDPSLARAISVGLNDIEARVELIESDKPGVSARLLEL